MRNVWRDGTFAELVKAPLENCFPLDERRLCHELGYSIPGLIYLSRLLVPYGGLRDIRLEPGETVIVCPATGAFGAAGVQVAVAMGARVIAMGRNETELTRLRAHVLKSTPWATVETVKITGDQAVETSALQALGTVDAILDLSPPAAANSTHLKSAIAALRRGGRCSVMGSVHQPIVDWNFVGNNLALKGKLMYEKEDVIMFVNLLERGMFPKGRDFADVKAFSLEQWKQAFDAAAEYTGVGKMVVITPQS